MVRNLTRTRGEANAWEEVCVTRNCRYICLPRKEDPFPLAEDLHEQRSAEGALRLQWGTGRRDLLKGMGAQRFAAERMSGEERKGKVDKED